MSSNGASSKRNSEAFDPRCIQRSALLLGMVTNIFGGFVYIYPIYTTALQNVTGMTDGQVTLTGTIAHFGLAVISYPASLVYRSGCGNKLSARKMDVVTNIVTMAFQILSSVALAFLVDLYCRQDDLTEQYSCQADHPIGGAVSFLYLVLGVGVGLAFAHAVWVNGANYHYDDRLKSASVSAISFAIGIGSMILEIAYHYVQTALGLVFTIRSLFWFQAVVFLVVGIFRIFFMYRIDTSEFEEKSKGNKAEPKKTLQDWAISSAPQSLLSIRKGMRKKQPSIKKNRSNLSMRQRDTGYNSTTDALLKNDHQVLNSSKLRNSAYSSDDDDELADSFEGNSSEGQCRMLCCATLPHLTFWAVFFGIGLGGTFQSMLGFFSPLYAQNQNEGEQKTFQSLCVFLAGQVLARALCVVVYRYYRVQTIVLILWEVMELVACVMLVVWPTDYALFIVACALFGMGFGGNLSSLAAIVAMHYPGGSLNFPFNFGITMLAPAFGNVFIGVVELLLTTTDCTGGTVNETDCNYYNSTGSECTWIPSYAPNVTYPIANDQCFQTCELMFSMSAEDPTLNCYYSTLMTFTLFGIFSVAFCVAGAGVTRCLMKESGMTYA
jgi:MFS family permease